MARSRMSCRSVAVDLLTVDIKSGKVAGKLSIATPPSRVQDFRHPPQPCQRSWPWFADGTRVLFLDTTTHNAAGPRPVARRARFCSIAFHPNGNLFLRAQRRQDLLASTCRRGRFKEYRAGAGRHLPRAGCRWLGQAPVRQRQSRDQRRARRGDQQAGQRVQSSSTSIPARRPTSTTRRSRACSIWSRPSRGRNCD